MFVLPSLDTEYFSLDDNEYITLREMLKDVPLDLYPKSEDQFHDLMFCFNIKED